MATVESVTGTGAVSRGDECRFHVDRRDRPDGSFWCNAQIVCGGQLLYGGGEAGYFDCTLYQHGEDRHVVGRDDRTHGEDGDAAMRIDTMKQVLEIRDDASGDRGAFTVTARVASVR